MTNMNLDYERAAMVCGHFLICIEGEEDSDLANANVLAMVKYRLHLVELGYDLLELDRVIEEGGYAESCVDDFEPLVDWSRM